MSKHFDVDGSSFERVCKYLPATPEAWTGKSLIFMIIACELGLVTHTFAQVWTRLFMKRVYSDY